MAAILGKPQVQARPGIGVHCKVMGETLDGMNYQIFEKIQDLAKKYLTVSLLATDIVVMRSEVSQRNSGVILTRVWSHDAMGYHMFIRLLKMGACSSHEEWYATMEKLAHGEMEESKLV